jgi:hypothetical protein
MTTRHEAPGFTEAQQAAYDMGQALANAQEADPTEEQFDGLLDHIIQDEKGGYAHYKEAGEGLLRGLKAKFPQSNNYDDVI